MRIKKTKTETIDATGHNWITTKKATCEEDGSRKCSNCDKVEKLTKLGHKFGKYEEVEATCTEDGYKSAVCSRCEKEDKTVYPALGHEWSEWSVTKEASCFEKGSKQRVCARCSEIEKLEIEMIEHSYPTEWTIVEDATVFKEGKKTKECSVCHDILQEAIPKKSPIPLIVGTSASVIVVASGIYFYLKKKAAKKIVEKVVEEGIEKELIDFSFKTRTVETTLDEEDELFKVLKAKTFLEVSIVEEIDSIVEDEQFIFESVIFSAMVLYRSGKASKSKLAESHRRFVNQIEQKMEEKLSRTMELNNIKTQALRELGYSEMNEEKLYCSKQAERVAIYGRRRIGKTYLVDEVLQDKIT